MKDALISPPPLPSLTLLLLLLENGELEGQEVAKTVGGVLSCQLYGFLGLFVPPQSEEAATPVALSRESGRGWLCTLTLAGPLTCSLAMFFSGSSCAGKRLRE